MSEINIIMVCYNSCLLTKRTIQSVLKNTKSIDYKFIIINNGSNDDTDAVIRSFLPNERIFYIENEENKGCGIGRNIGFRNIDDNCKYIIIIDNDIYAPCNWDIKLINFMENNIKIGLGGPATNFAGTPQLIENIKDLNSDEEIEKYAKNHRSKKIYSLVPDKWSVIGFCQIIRREVLDKVGFFDEEFKLYGCEDNDFCYRVQKNGWDLAYIDSVFVYHHGNGGLSQLGEKGALQWAENRNYFKQKNGFL